MGATGGGLEYSPRRGPTPSASAAIKEPGKGQQISAVAKRHGQAVSAEASLGQEHAAKGAANAKGHGLGKGAGHSTTGDEDGDAEK